MVILRFVLAYFCLLTSGFAQAVDGSLNGRVLDTTGEPVIGANVIVTSPGLQGNRGTVSDSTGGFTILQLPPGTYIVRISHVSFANQTVENVRIRLGKTTWLESANLRGQDLQMPEVIVSQERVLLDPHSTAAGANLVDQDLALLPVERNYRSVATILPHANPSYYGDEANIGGSTGAENRYFINGTDVTDSFRGTTGTNLPYNFIKEIEIKTGGYEPEYRSALGGILNVITYSGGNTLSGQVFGFFTNNNFAAEQRTGETEPPKGDFSQYDVGFGLGGPLMRDKLWFYVAYNPSFRNEQVQLPGLGYYPDEIRAQVFAGKITWKASEAFDMTATILGDPTTRKGVGKTFGGQPTVLTMGNPDPLLSDITTGGYVASMDGRLLASSSVIIQGNFSWTQRKDRYMPATDRGANEFFFYDVGQGMLSGGYSGRVDITGSSLVGQVAGTFLMGNHTLKTGIAYRETSLDSQLKDFAVLQLGDSLYMTFDVSQIGTIRNRIPSLYVQDSWSLSEHLQITGGIRWDGLFIIGSDGKLWNQVLTQYQPRIGITFLPGEGRNDKVFASFGRYAEDLLMYGSTLYHIAGAYQRGSMYTHDPRSDPAGGQPIIDVTTVAPDTKDLYGQYFDEVTVGYERLLGNDFKLAARGIFRTLKEVIEDGEDPAGSGSFHYANPGHAPMTSYPSPRREYLALELTFEKAWGTNWNFLASYVLSRTYGNYLGLYLQDNSAAIPNAGPQFDFPDLLINATGPLPNDRTHALKLIGSYRTPFGITCGLSLFWATGTPLSEYDGSVHGIQHAVFLGPRGTAGRLPSIWDLNIRLAYDLPSTVLAGIRPRFIIDLFHLGSPSVVVQQDQLRYAGVDQSGNYIPNPAFGMATRFQPAMSMRLGIEIGF